MIVQDVLRELIVPGRDGYHTSERPLSTSLLCRAQRTSPHPFEQGTRCRSALSVGVQNIYPACEAQTVFILVPISCMDSYQGYLRYGVAPGFSDGIRPGVIEALNMEVFRFRIGLLVGFGIHRA